MNRSICVVNAKAGISSLFDDSPEADVYTTNGILLKKCADKDYLSGLAKGIYIIKVAGKEGCRKSHKENRCNVNR